MAGPTLLRRLGFGGPKLVGLPFAAYGKLPIYRDFIRNGSGAEAAALRGWLDRGFSHYWETRPEYHEHQIGAHAFILSLPDTSERVLGYLWGSHDNEGLRRFPFALFVSLAASRLDGPAAALDALAQLAARARDVEVELRRAGSLDESYRVLRAAGVALTLRPEADARERLRRELKGVSVGELAESVYGADGGGRWAALLALLERHAHSGEGALRLPGSPLLPAFAQAALWAVLGCGDARACRTIVPLERRGPVLLGRDVRPDDVFLLHPEMPGYEQVEDVRSRVPGEAEATCSEAPDERPVAALLGAG